MYLNYEEIKAKEIIPKAKDKEFTDSSYNLTISKIIDMENKESESFNLKPQGMAYVIFEEELNLPSNVIGFAHVKTSLTKDGIMATHIGIIDPTYKGYISTLLINFGKKDCYLAKGESALRITFSEIVPPSKHIKLNSIKPSYEYLQAVKKSITNLDEKFLNINIIGSEVKKAILKTVITYSIIFASGSFLLSFYFSFKNSSDKTLENNIKMYETKLSTIIESNKTLQDKISIYDLQLKSMQQYIDLQEEKIKKLSEKQK